jgi:hypothetical protein
MKKSAKGPKVKVKDLKPKKGGSVTGGVAKKSTSSKLV